MNSEILAEVIRGETIESIHRGHLIVVDGEGKKIAQLGNPQTVTFFRSSAKPFQVIPFLKSGAAESFGFSEKEIAPAAQQLFGQTRFDACFGETNGRGFQNLRTVGKSGSAKNFGNHF
ncbi:MAG: asparaginase [Acidobacteria bacterium]|nr:asparaginase [Acidobacteriota bacterium]